MLILFAKYTLFMCFAIINYNPSCEEKLNEVSTGGGVYWKAACTAKCLYFETFKNFESCFDFCQSTNMSNNKIIKKINENHDLQFLCRDDRSITIKIIIPTTLNTSKVHNPLSTQESLLITPSDKHNSYKKRQEIYVINISPAHEANYVSVYFSNEHFITIGNLDQNTTYNVSVAVVYSSDEYSIIAKARQFNTLRRGYKPKEIQEISLLKFAVDDADEMRVTALISWKPSYDMTCFYDLICYSSSPDREDNMEVTPIEIRNPQSLYTYSLDNLTFATVYNVGIRAINTNDSSKESALIWEIIYTPSCIEWHDYNFNICAPLRPEGLSANEVFLSENEFSLNISWQHPKYEPDYYTLNILDLDQINPYNVHKYNYNVSKDQHWYFIPSLTLTGLLYEIHLTAYTPGGSSRSKLTQPKKIPLSDKHYVLKLVFAILAPIFCIAIFSLTIFIVCHRRAKLKRFQERCKYFEELEKKAPIDPKSTFDFPTKNLSVPPSEDDINQFQLDLEEKLFFNDDMEINRNDVDLYEVLGEGAFGLVRRGIFHNRKNNDVDDIREVAVKMLKDQPSVDDVRAFRREIEVMKSVGRHPNIVGIIGHCTKKYNEMLLLTEYCSFGNLLNFLRNEWKYLHELSIHTVSDSTVFTDSANLQQYPLATKKHRKLSDSTFNFDTTIMEKIKLKYKNLNSNPSTASTAYVKSPNESMSPPSPPPLPPPFPALKFNQKHPQNLTGKFNKSYGYEEICTNACKCRVVILSPENDFKANKTEYKASKKLQPKISNKCECRLKKHKLHSVDNKSYYKNLINRRMQQPLNEDDDMEKEILAKREPLRFTDLLDIAKQVALGMEFLSKNKVVHRDLAARNVLVSADRTVKIADFGLSRDVYQENVYKKTGNGKLPIKWLAIESMTHQVYTSQSDVWSFGILLYEIITLGGTPYPSIPTNRLLQLLKTGYRMEKPSNCSQGLYNLMVSCWHFNPAERPNFTEVIKILDSLLSESPQLPIERFIVPKQQKNSPETPTPDDSYLKPL